MTSLLLSVARLGPALAPRMPGTLDPPPLAPLHRHPALSTLPTDILSRVLSFLPFHDRKLSASRVSRQFSKVVSSLIVTQELIDFSCRVHAGVLVFPVGRLRDKTVSSWIDRGVWQYLEALTLVACLDLTCHAFQLATCPRLRHVSLRTTRLPLCAFNALPALTSLDIRQSHLLFSSVQADLSGPGFEALRHLTLEFSRDATSYRTALTLSEVAAFVRSIAIAKPALSHLTMIVDSVSGEIGAGPALPPSVCVVLQWSNPVPVTYRFGAST